MNRVKFWLNVFNIGVGFLIFCSTVYVSFSHTLHLFKSVGFTGHKAIAATLAGEALFIMGAVNATIALLYKLKVGSPPMVAFILGLALTGWANASAHSMYGLMGIALGLTTPVFMFVAKNVISDTIKKFTRENDQKKAGTTQSHNTNDSHTASHSHTVKEPHTVRESHTVSHAATRSHTVTRSHTDTHSHTGEDSHNVSESHTDNEQELSHSDSHTATRNNSHDNTHDNSHGDSHGSHGDSHGNSHTTSRSHNADDSHTPTRSHGETNTVRDSHTVRESHNETTTHSHSESHTVKDSHTATQSHDESRTPIEWAVHIYEQTGALPSIRKLAEVADCSEWQARKALSQLKKQKKIS